MREENNRPVWLDFAFLYLTPIIGMALGVGFTIVAGIDQAAYANLVVNLFYLLACAVLLRVYKFSRSELGLLLDKKRIIAHVAISLIIFCLYMVFYVLVYRISGLKPLTANTFWGLLNYVVVVIVEEIYFRGMMYSFLEKHFSAFTALTASSLLFGFFHARQGVISILSKSFTGWLWGSVRYATGMIYLLIFPVHFAYNAVWLLFEGNWSHPTPWAAYVLPVVELGLGLVIVVYRRIQVQRQKMG